MREKKLKNIQEMEETYEQILERRQCVSLKDLAVKGGDLLAIGVERGPQIGEVLDQLLEVVLEEPEKNQKEQLLEEAAKLIKS